MSPNFVHTLPTLDPNILRTNTRCQTCSIKSIYPNHMLPKRGPVIVRLWANLTDLGKAHKLLGGSLACYRLIMLSSRFHVSCRGFYCTCAVFVTTFGDYVDDLKDIFCARNLRPSYNYINCCPHWDLFMCRACGYKYNFI